MANSIDNLNFTFDSKEFIMTLTTVESGYKLLLKRCDSQFYYTCSPESWQVESILMEDWIKSLDICIRFVGKGKLTLTLVNKKNDYQVEFAFILNSNESYMQEVERAIAFKYQEDIMEIESQVFDIVNMQKQSYAKIGELRSLTNQLSKEAAALPSNQDYLKEMDEIGWRALDKGKDMLNQSAVKPKSNLSKFNNNLNKDDCLPFIRNYRPFKSYVKDSSVSKPAVNGDIRLIHLVSKTALIIVTDLNDVFLMNLSTMSTEPIELKALDRINKIDSDESMVCFHLYSSIMIYDYEKKKILNQIMLNAIPAGIAFSYRSLFIATKSGKLYEYKYSNFQMIRQKDFQSDIVSMTSIKGSGIIVVSFDFCLCTYDIDKLIKHSACSLNEKIHSVRIAGKFAYCQLNMKIEVWNYLEGIKSRSNVTLSNSILFCSSAAECFFFGTDSELYACFNHNVLMMEINSGLKAITSFDDRLVYCDNKELLIINDINYKS